mgnify:CR=1 FL=1
MKKLIILLIVPTIILAQIVAITSEGKFVILHENGTWEYDKKTAPIDLEKTKSNEPSIGDFSIIHSSYKWENGRFRIIGEIKNIGEHPAGIQVEAVARDKHGKIVDSVKFWPNSTNNIAPGQSTGVGYTVTRDKRAVRIGLKKVSVTQW